MTGKDFDILNEAYRTKVSEVAPAVAVVGRAVAGIAAKKAGQALAKRFKKDEEETKEAAKPDYIDADGDGDKKEPMKKAFKDKKKKKPINAAHCTEKATDQRPKDEVNADETIKDSACDPIHSELQEPIDQAEKENKKSKKTAKESINNSNKGNIMSENKSTFDELYESVMSEDEDFELGLPSEGEHDELELGDDEGDEGGDVTVTLSQADVDCLKSILDQVGGGDDEGEEFGDEPDPLEAGAHESAEVTEEDTQHTKDGSKPGHDPSDGGGKTTEPAADSLGGKSSGDGSQPVTDEIDGGTDTGEGKQPGHTKAKGTGKPGSQAV